MMVHGLLKTIGFCACIAMVQAQIEFPAGKGAGKGKHIVLVSGDEEYRSEEALPELAAILSKRHGFRCTVLFAIDPADGTVRPDKATNIPGLEALRTADLMILFTRFRDLPDEQMKHFADYLETGKPIVAMRTATHAFQLKSSTTYARFSSNDKPTDGGFGRQVLGETWISHHGKHNVESTRGVVAEGQQAHPILRGVRDVWGPSDVYKIRLPLDVSIHPLLMGQILAGMKPTDGPVADARNNPMMPVAWTKSYTSATGKKPRSFTTTMGAAEDLLNEGVRRMLINACYWGVKMEAKIKANSDVGLVGTYTPTHFSFGGYKKGQKPEDFRPR